jgi:hypothetical protein
MGEDFPLSQKSETDGGGMDEQEHFSDMGFDEPRRYPGCRKKNSKGEDPDAKRRHTNKKKHFRMKYEE